MDEVGEVVEAEVEAAVEAVDAVRRRPHIRLTAATPATRRKGWDCGQKPFG